MHTTTLLYDSDFSLRVFGFKDSSTGLYRLIVLVVSPTEIIVGILGIEPGSVVV